LAWQGGGSHSLVNESNDNVVAIIITTTTTTIIIIIIINAAITTAHIFTSNIRGNIHQTSKQLRQARGRQRAREKSQQHAQAMILQRRLKI
jgi:hypothetical protein